MLRFTNREKFFNCLSTPIISFITNFLDDFVQGILMQTPKKISVDNGLKLR